MLQEVNSLLIIGSVIIVSFYAGRLINRLKAPVVIGYVLLGVILGKSFLNILDHTVLKQLAIINDLALGLIAFVIGSELHISKLRILGKAIFSIALAESLGAFLFVSFLIYFFSHNLAASLILGAIASATAPAATVAVINQYRSRGPLTTTILGVVGIDDVFSLIIYAFAAAIVTPVIISNRFSFHFADLLLPVKEIFLSVSFGLILGYLLAVILRRLQQRPERFTVLLGWLLLGEGIALQFGLSELLLVMTMAFFSGNLAKLRILPVVDMLNVVANPIIAIFFCFAGAKLDIHAFSKIGWLSFIYLIARILGKYLGARLGAKLAKAPGVISQYIGLALWPQIGVAVALAILVDRDFGHVNIHGQVIANMAINILLFTTIITEIVGPISTKYGLYKAGEIKNIN